MGTIFPVDAGVSVVPSSKRFHHVPLSEVTSARPWPRRDAGKAPESDSGTAGPDPPRTADPTVNEQETIIVVGNANRVVPGTLTVTTCRPIFNHRATGRTRPATIVAQRHVSNSEYCSARSRPPGADEQPSF